MLFGLFTIYLSDHNPEKCTFLSIHFTGISQRFPCAKISSSSTKGQACKQPQQHDKSKWMDVLRILKEQMKDNVSKIKRSQKYSLRR